MNKTHRKHRYYEKPMPKIKMATGYPVFADVSTGE